MPDLRDLLEGAVDDPAPLDLGRLGERVGRHQRRRRLAVVAAMAVVVVALAVAGVGLRGTGGENGDGAEPVPPIDVGPAPSTPPSPSTSTPSSTPTSTTTGSTELPACASEDLDVVPTGEGATAQTAIHAEISRAGAGQLCTIDAPATFTLRDLATDEVLAIEGNPRQVGITGTVGPTGADVDQGSLVLSGCLPGDGFDDRSEIAIEIEIEGLGTYRGTAIGSRCVEEGSGAVLAGPAG